MFILFRHQAKSNVRIPLKSSDRVQSTNLDQGFKHGAILYNEAEVFSLSIGTLRKTRRQRQRERHKTKSLMNKTIAVHVRYNSWYISLPSSVKQQREMTKLCVVWRT